MRIFPIALIVVGIVALLRHYGFVDAAFMHVLWPLLLIALGIALLVRRPRWRAGLHDRWERRMHRHFGPGWANLSDQERDRFRAGMQQWRTHAHAGEGGGAPSPGPSPASGEPR